MLTKVPGVTISQETYVKPFSCMPYSYTMMYVNYLSEQVGAGVGKETSHVEAGRRSIAESLGQEGTEAGVF